MLDVGFSFVFMAGFYALLFVGSPASQNRERDIQSEMRDLRHEHPFLFRLSRMGQVAEAQRLRDRYPRRVFVPAWILLSIGLLLVALDLAS